MPGGKKAKGKAKQNKPQPKPKGQNKKAKSGNAEVSRVIKALSTMAGGFLGGPMGSAAGALAGEGISKIAGFGDYTVKSNTLSTQGTSSAEVPSFVTSGMNSVRMRHREFLGDLVSNGSSFQSTQYRLNPGAPETFPWLSSFAPKFQQYKLHGMVVQFKSTSSEYASGAALGAVVIATNYTPTDYPYASKSDMENTGFCVSAKPSLSIIHAIECDPRSQTMAYKYVRDPNNPVLDANLFDWGVTTVAAQGLSAAATTVIGELWVSYDIEFIRPIQTVSTTLIPGSQKVAAPTITNLAISPLGKSTDLIYSWGGAGLPASAISDYAQYVPTSGVVLSIDAVNNRTYFPKPGHYTILLFVTGAGTALASSVAPYSTITVSQCTVTTNHQKSSTAGDSASYEFNIIVDSKVTSSTPAYITWTKLSTWTAADNQTRSQFIINAITSTT